ncbi:MAG: amino acid permease [Erysipelotrichaceae bacterium]|nr:amino acid permease [Erysipelotrichaceae bacterium]
MSIKNDHKEMDRYLSPFDVWAMGFGCAVGWGAFVMPGTTFLPVAGPLGTLIALTIGTIIILVIGKCFSYLMQRSPMTGGVYSYTKEAFGRDHAFLCSWFLCLSYLTIVFLNGSALFLVIRTIFGNSFHTGISYMVAGNRIDLGEIVVSITALIGVGGLFIFATPVLQKFHTVAGVLLALGSLAVALCCLPKTLQGDVVMSWGTGNISPYYGIASLIILAPWAFVGFEVISFDTAHFNFPVSKAKRIVPISILVSGFVYIVMTLVSVSAVPEGYGNWMEYIRAMKTLEGTASVPTFFAAQTNMGKTGLAVMAVTAFSAILTGIIGGYRATLRILSTMAEDKILSEKFNETRTSILFVMVLSVLLSLLGRNTLNWFVDLTSFGAIVGYGYTSAATCKIAKTENNKKMMTAGILGAAISAVFVIVQLVPHISAMEAMGSEAFLLLSLWCLLGFIFYWRTVQRSTLAEYSGMSVSGIVLFSLLVYSALMWMAKLLFKKESIAEIRSSIIVGGIVLILIILVGLMVMLYIQDYVRKKHESVEREKIRAVEGSLAKSRFLFNMSHDIRTPMNAIIGYTDLAKEKADGEEMRGYLSKISSSSRHLLSLINDILEMSRIETGRLELEYLPEDLTEVFEGMRDLFQAQMDSKNIDFSVRYTQIQNRYVWCDRKNLNRVLLNIISNAYKFTRENGEVSVSLSQNGTLQDKYGSYEIVVQDNGIGMSKEFAEKMFTAFERERTSTESGIEGTGLGLAITKSIIDLMGGTIEVLTTPGSGTKMIVRIKFLLANEEDLEKNRNKAEKANTSEVDFSGRRLLLVEDNAINMEIAKEILSRMGFEIETAENGQIALDMVSKSSPDHYDAVLMDIQMPIMDGYAATKAIRSLRDKKLADIPILAMTANAFKEDEEAAMEAGMNGHIAKPIDIQDLTDKLRSAMKDKE